MGFINHTSGPCLVDVGLRQYAVISENVLDVIVLSFLLSQFRYLVEWLILFSPSLYFQMEKDAPSYQNEGREI